MGSTPDCSSELLLLILSQVPGIGPTRANALVRRYGADPVLLEAGAEMFMTVPGIGEQLSREIASTLANSLWRTRARQAAQEQLDRARQLNATVITILDPNYPKLLSEIYDPPPLLFVRGDPLVLCRPSIAIVGTRKATSYGKEATEYIGRNLVLNGYTIISGLAYGIDMTAHRVAVDSGGTTIAVLGCGIDTIYTDPAGRLWPKILEHGAIISEEWIGREPAPGNFPKRNRLIAGLSLGTLIVESDIKGGSLITASCALEQNREVFAVPGSIFSRASRGTNRLIQQCQAKPVHSADDILAELVPSGMPHLHPASGSALSPVTLTGEETLIVKALEDETLHIDLIAEKTGIPINSLLCHLFELELKQVVLQEPGQLFRKRPLLPD
jgi:DNA processing protein